MINNRQNGRRRGRGGQQARNGQPGAPDRGSRLDNRARGNAAQLLEKYKTLARDAQMQGDRVNTEYYLQFADHYFRVLSENRARFEEQRPPARQNDNRDDFGSDDEGGDHQRGYQGRDDQNNDDSWDDGDQPSQPEQRAYAPRAERQDRSDRSDRPERQDRGDRQDRPERAERQDRGDRQDRPDRSDRQERAAQADGNGEARGEARDGASRESAPRAAAPREGGTRSRRGSSNAAPVNGNVGSNGFAAPDFLNAPLSPRFEMDEPETEDAPRAEAAPEAEAPAPKPRRTRRPRAETAPVDAQ